MQSGDDVVVFLTALIVEQLPLGSLLNDLDGDLFPWRGCLRSQLQDIQRCARIAIRDGCDHNKSGVFDLDVLCLYGTPEQRLDMIVAERLEHEDTSARKQGRVHLE